MTEQRKKRLLDKLRRSRARLMVRDPDIALVLMYMSFVATKEVHRISTNGKTIFFDPDWIQKLSNFEIDYILSHEVIHVVLGDTKRPAFLCGDRFHHACDIIACSVMRDRGWSCEKLQHIGNLTHRTYFPGHEGNELEPLEAYREVPFDPSAMSPAERRKFQIDSDQFWGGKTLPSDATYILFPGYDELLETPSKEEKGKLIRVKYKVVQPLLLDGASDISNTDDNSDGSGICNNTDSDMEPITLPDISNSCDCQENTPNNESNYDELDAAIDRLLNMIEEMEYVHPRQSELLDRIWKGVGASKLEWKRLLASFLQEEINDYSFQPPDRRFSESDFFLPDFNLAEQNVKDILFMVDTSGSINDDVISAVYGEICAAIEQFGSSLQGKLGFFDTRVITPVPFSSIHQLLKIRPKGGGYTDFDCIFRWIKQRCNSLPSCLVIFTDGMGDYPSEADAMGIPVLWILYGNEPFPRWGRRARIKN